METARDTGTITRDTTTDATRAAGDRYKYICWDVTYTELEPKQKPKPHCLIIYDTTCLIIDQVCDDRQRKR